MCHRSEDLLSQLTAAASWESPWSPSSKLRALKALRRTLNGLLTKRFVIEQPKSNGMPGQRLPGETKSSGND